jgi:glycosyltransferase involved in cell wall biosynthesis
LADLIDSFLGNPALPLTLSIAGEGPQTAELKQRTASDPRIEWVGFFNERSDLGRWASSCHLLVNPRPSGYGNLNNFPSKLFDYMQLGRAVLSSTDATLEHAFGDALIWYDSGKQQALAQALIDISGRSNNDLLKSGEELLEKYSMAYSWTQTIQGLRKWLASV